MSSNYKQVRNGNGTDLYINDETYIRVGKNGNNVVIRSNGNVVCFDSVQSLVNYLER